LPDGSEIDAQELSVDYVMGSGNHVRTYIHRSASGALIELPLAWYAQNGGFWAMNPGHDRDYALAPRKVAYECMSCHNARSNIPAGHEEPGSEPVYSGGLPAGHRLPALPRTRRPPHRRGTNARRKPETIRAAIVNPGRLSPERQMEVCMQCHLETTSLQLPNEIRRFNRAVLVRGRAAARGFCSLFRSRAEHRAQRRFRDRALGVPAAQIPLLSGKQGGNDMPDLPQPTRHSTRRKGDCTL
jgi:hypothetical protein